MKERAEKNYYAWVDRWSSVLLHVEVMSASSSDVDSDAEGPRPIRRRVNVRDLIEGSASEVDSLAEQRFVLLLVWCLRSF